MNKLFNLLLGGLLLLWSTTSNARIDGRFLIVKNGQEITFEITPDQKWSDIRSVLFGMILARYPELDARGVKIVNKGAEVNYRARSSVTDFASDPLQVLIIKEVGVPVSMRFRLEDTGGMVNFDRGTIEPTDSERLTRSLLTSIAVTLGKNLDGIKLMFKHRESGRYVDITEAVKAASKYDVVLLREIKVSDLPSIS